MSNFDGLSLKERIALGAADIAKHRAIYEAEFGMEALPKDVQQLVWNKAWEDGHSSGFDEVRSHYMDAAEIATSAWNARRTARVPEMEAALLAADELAAAFEGPEGFVGFDEGKARAALSTYRNAVEDAA